MKLPRPSYMIVLVALLGMIAAVPFAESFPGERLDKTIALLGLVLPILAVSTATDSQRHRRIAIVLAVATLVGSTSQFLGLTPVVSSSISLVFLAYTTVLVVGALIRSREVTSDVLAGAFAGFLLIGVTFCVAYGLLLRLTPDAIADGGRPMHLSTLMYFSYITMLSIGFGDVVPVHPAARVLAVFEGLTGLAFNTLVIAVLVANHMSQRERN